MTKETKPTKAEADAARKAAVDQVFSGDLEFECETLAAQLREVLVEVLRSSERPWGMLTEREQIAKCEVLDQAVLRAVRSVVHFIADYEFPSCAVVLGEVKVKGEKGIEAKISAPNHHDPRTILGDAVGQVVMLVVADPEQFSARHVPYDVDPDQPDLPTGGGHAE